MSRDIFADYPRDINIYKKLSYLIKRSLPKNLSFDEKVAIVTQDRDEQEFIKSLREEDILKLDKNLYKINIYDLAIIKKYGERSCRPTKFVHYCKMGIRNAHRLYHIIGYRVLDPGIGIYHYASLYNDFIDLAFESDKEISKQTGLLQSSVEYCKYYFPELNGLRESYYKNQNIFKICLFYAHYHSIDKIASYLNISTDEVVSVIDDRAYLLWTDPTLDRKYLKYRNMHPADMIANLKLKRVDAIKIATRLYYRLDRLEDYLVW